MAKKSDDNKKQSLGAQYQTLLVRYPLVANAIQGGIITAIGVVTSQIIAPPPGGGIDWTEVAVMTLINMAWITPILLVLFAALDKVEGGPVAKLIVDQLVFSPIFLTSIVSWRYILLGGDISKLSEFLVPIIQKAQMTSWLFWIPTRFLIISYVPSSLALLVNSLASLVWTVIFAMAMK